MNIEHHSLPSEGASVGAVGCGPTGLGSTPSPHPNSFTDQDFDELREIITGARNGKPWDHDRIKELWSKLNDQAFQ